VKAIKCKFGHKGEVPIVADETLEPGTLKIVGEVLGKQVTIECKSEVVLGINGTNGRTSPFFYPETIGALCEAMWIACEARPKEIHACSESISGAQWIQPIPEGQR